MFTHKEVNTFIRKYNKQVVIKGYSKMNLSNKVALVERRIKENKGNKYDPATEARLEWSQLKKAKGIVDKDREARKKAYFDKQREEAKKAKEAKDKPKPKIVVKAIVKKKRT